MLDFLQHHWLALSLPLIGVTLLLLRRWLLGPAFILLGVGGLSHLDTTWSLGVLLTGAGLLVAMLLLVILSGNWSVEAGYAVACVLFFGLGAWGARAASDFLIETGQFLLSFRVDEDAAWWLLGLLLVPLLIWLSYGRLAGLGPVRSRLALGIRCLLVIFVCLALAEVHARRAEHDVTVLFLIDRSLSIPTDFKDGKDRRRERILNFINQAVTQRGAGRTEDRTGVIVFGRFPRLELPPAKVGQLPIKDFHSVVDDNYTDIAAALKLALASFPEGASKRIVLVSDGNENLGDAIEQARIAKHNGVRIDVVAVAAGRRNTDEVMVERIEAPPLSDKTSKIPFKVVLRSFHPDVVCGQLHLIRKAHPILGLDELVPVEPRTVLTMPVKLHFGLNVRFFQQPGLQNDEAVTYEAKFEPTHVENAKGQRIQEGLPNDRLDNNRAGTTIIARSQRAILIVESVSANAKNGNHTLLAQRLALGGGLKVITLPSDALPKDPVGLAMVLSKFDCVILGNVPADELTEVQQSVIRSNTHEQGAGLIMIGGPQSFGAGGWQDTELEKALPVTCDTKSTKIDVPGGLVLIMHASEMLDGNGWQKKIAKLAIEKLTRADMIGMTVFDGGGHQWHIPFQKVGADRARLFQFVDSLQPGDMPDLEPSLRMAHAELIKPEYNLGTKHVIFISDGDTTFPNDAFLKKVGDDGVTLTTVCITSHGLMEVARMKEISGKVVTKSGKRGSYHHVKNPNELPRIYAKETRLVSQSFVHQQKFDPRIVRREGPVIGLADLPPLHGFVRTTARPTRLVDVPIETPKIGDDEFPLLAYWNYGLGRSVAFTSDARSNEDAQFWDRDWAGSKNSTRYTQFWQQVVNWARRPDDNKNKFLSVTTDQRNGRVRVIVEALDEKRAPITGVDFQQGVTALSFEQKDARKIELKFEEKSPGIYEADFQADEVGSFLLNIKGTWLRPKGNDSETVTESVRAGVTIPYSPEFAEMESRPELLHTLAKMTDGKFYEESDEVLAKAAASGELYTPIANHESVQSMWFLLVLLAGVGMFVDVAVRRLSIEPAAVRLKLQNLWASLRGRQTVEGPADPFMERLKSRKAKVEETLAKDQETRRPTFQNKGGPPPPPPPSADAGPAPPKDPAPKAPSTPGVKKPAEEADYASRLMRAKKRAQEDRDKK